MLKFIKDNKVVMYSNDKDELVIQDETLKESFEKKKKITDLLKEKEEEQ